VERETEGQVEAEAGDVTQGGMLLTHVRTGYVGDGTGPISGRHARQSMNIVGRRGAAPKHPTDIIMLRNLNWRGGWLWLIDEHELSLSGGRGPAGRQAGNQVAGRHRKETAGRSP